ncbi:MAG: hypothetical protein GXC73_09900 [Chitinophagaceae bacterium]|nr:hypothetical protein [Chitinophagaceae bacterium]
MKAVVASILFLCCSSFIQTGKYPVAKLYAYQQKVSGGANFSSDEKGRAKQQHYVYLLVRKDRTISIDDVWISGRKVAFKTEEVSSPVTIDKSISLGNTPATETLVPATQHTVMQIVLTSSAAAAMTSSPARYRSYPLLIRYSENGTSYYLGSKSWNILDPKVNQ